MPTEDEKVAQYRSARWATLTEMHVEVGGALLRTRDLHQPGAEMDSPEKFRNLLEVMALEYEAYHRGGPGQIIDG